MEQFKENIKLRNPQNVVSSVLLLCTLVLTLTAWAIASKSYVPEAALAREEIAASTQVR